MFDVLLRGTRGTEVRKGGEKEKEERKEMSLISEDQYSSQHQLKFTINNIDIVPFVYAASTGS